jgi:hypothetical protein
LQSKLGTRKYKRPDAVMVTVRDGERSVIGLGNLVSRKIGDRLRDMGANIMDIEEDT